MKASEARQLVANMVEKVEEIQKIVHSKEEREKEEIIKIAREESNYHIREIQRKIKIAASEMSFKCHHTIMIRNEELGSYYIEEVTKTVKKRFEDDGYKVDYVMQNSYVPTYEGTTCVGMEYTNDSVVIGVTWL